MTTVDFIVNNTGTPAVSSQFSKYMGSFAKLCGFNKKFTNTVVRKTIVSGVHPTASVEEKEVLAKKMMHDPR